MPEPTVREALRDAATAFSASGSATSRLDAEVLLAHHLGRDRSWVIAHPDEPLQAPEAWARIVERRVDGEPVAYLRGFKEWHGLRLAVDARALIPRPETELLADAAGAEIAARVARSGGMVAAWDVGTGSGAIPVLLARRFAEEIERGRLRLIASDLSGDALALAGENLAAHGVAASVELARTDLLDEAGGRLPRADVVTANLPYVPTDEARAPERGLGHEPDIAIDGGPDGLVVLRRLLADLPVRTAPGATILLEIGAGQGAAVAAMAPPDASVSTLRDLAGVERVVRIDMADWDHDRPAGP